CARRARQGGGTPAARGAHGFPRACHVHLHRRRVADHRPGPQRSAAERHPPDKRAHRKGRGLHPGGPPVQRTSVLGGHQVTAAPGTGTAPAEGEFMPGLALVVIVAAIVLVPLGVWWLIRTSVLLRVAGVDPQFVRTVPDRVRYTSMGAIVLLTATAATASLTVALSLVFTARDWPFYLP